MPKWIISKFLSGRKLKKILIVGIAYKKDLDDTRESPAINFIKILKEKRILVDFYDPNIRYLKSRNLNKTYKSIKLNSKSLKKYDCAVIVTDHSNIDYKLIKENSKLIVDTRNVYKFKSDKILKL